MENAHKFGSVVLLGPPNAGKSTLLNALLGQKLAIVTAKPQTTRNRISGILTRDDAQVVFLDTPGVHRVGGPMNRMLLTSAWNAAAQADVWVILLDADKYVRKPDLLDTEADPLKTGAASFAGPLILALNKVDAVGDKKRLLPLMEKVSRIWPRAELMPISAAKGDGLDALLARVLEHLPEGPPAFPEDQLSTAPLRFLASEVVREKLFMALRQEVPYGVAVEIENWLEEPGLTRIGALIHVAKEGHKAMVIGKGGSVLKEVGRQARLELKELIGGKVHLELWVKVRRDWTEDPAFLRSMGLGE